MGGALALVGCGSATPQPTPAPDDDVVNPDDDPADDDPGNVVAEYGAPAPPPDEGSVDEDDPGTMAPKYGAPPPPN